MRLVLRKLEVNIDDVPVVFSTEKPPVQLMETEADDPAEYAMLPNFRSRIMPVLGTIPSMFGLVAATYVLNTLSEKKFKSMLPQKPRPKVVTRIWNLLNTNEEKLYKVPRAQRTFSMSQVEYAFAEMFGGRCALTGVIDDLVMRRWRRDEQISITNCCLMSSEMAKKHDQQTPLESFLTIEQIDSVNEILEEEKQFSNKYGHLFPKK